MKEITVTKEEVEAFLDRSCDLAGWRSRTWRHWIRIILRDVVLEGSAFDAAKVSGREDWYRALFRAMGENWPEIPQHDGRYRSEEIESLWKQIVAHVLPFPATVHESGFVEESWVILGTSGDEFTLVQPQKGDAASVEFDWRWVIERQEKHGDVIGFAHTHPPGVGNEPSERDIRTMQVWYEELGYSLMCVIECEGDVGAWIFHGVEDCGTKFHEEKGSLRKRWRQQEASAGREPKG